MPRSVQIFAVTWVYLTEEEDHVALHYSSGHCGNGGVLCCKTQLCYSAPQATAHLGTAFCVQAKDVLIGHYDWKSLCTVSLSSTQGPKFKGLKLQWTPGQACIYGLCCVQYCVDSCLPSVGNVLAMTKLNVMQPYWPWCRKEAAPGPQFFPVDEKLSVSVAAVMGLQHALAMCGGIIVSTCPVSADIPVPACCFSLPIWLYARASAPVCLLPCQRSFTEAYTFFSMHVYTEHGCPRTLIVGLAAASRSRCFAQHSVLMHSMLLLSLPWQNSCPVPTLTGSWLHCRRHPSWYLQQPRTSTSSNVSSWLR